MIDKYLTDEWELATAIVCQVSERGVQEPRRASGNELSGARELDKSVRPRYQCRSRTEYRCASLSADQGPAFSPTRDVIIILYRPTQLWDRQDAGRTLTVMVIICSRTMESYWKILRNLNSEKVLNIRSLWFIYVLFFSNHEKQIPLVMSKLIWLCRYDRITIDR